VASLASVLAMAPRSPAGSRRREYAVALLARTTGLTSSLAQELPVARAYACDVGVFASVERTFESVESELGSVDVLIYNAGKGVWGSAEEVTFEDFEATWRTNTFGAFAAARSVIPAIKRRAAGHIIFIGATLTPRRRQDGRICFGQGRSAQSC
jgi:NAD(P)-dependent dehydrogenase (short-subunit alcohol dehydrogenase family)